MNEYEDHWQMTYTGKKFHFLDPSVDEIDIRDIAHALALTCRFAGHCSKFYSVAEHSCRVSDFVGEKSRLAALLHDAAEAYVPDIPSPIKAVTKDLRDISLTIEESILSKYKAFEADWHEIREIDQRMCLSEAKKLGLNTTDWAYQGKIIPLYSLGWNPVFAESSFMRLFRDYSKNA